MAEDLCDHCNHPAKDHYHGTGTCIAKAEYTIGPCMCTTFVERSTDA